MSMIILSFLGGIMASDSTAALQIMISRPVFCGPVIGYLSGDVLAGLYIGMIMELLWIAVIPLGNSIPPDSTIVTVCSTLTAANYDGSYRLGYILVVVLLMVPFGVLFKKFDMYHRNFNSRFTYFLEKNIDLFRFHYISLVTCLSWFLFILKAAAYIFIVSWLASIFVTDLFLLFNEKLQAAFEHSAFIVPAIGFGTSITTFMFKKSSLVKK